MVHEGFSSYKDEGGGERAARKFQELNPGS